MQKYTGTSVNPQSLCSTVYHQRHIFLPHYKTTSYHQEETQHLRKCCFRKLWLGSTQETKISSNSSKCTTVKDFQSNDCGLVNKLFRDVCSIRRRSCHSDLSEGRLKSNFSSLNAFGTGKRLHIQTNSSVQILSLFFYFNSC